MAVVVQRMVRADVAGVLFTCDPVHGRRDRMVVEAVLGLGEAAVSGAVTPDHYVPKLGEQHLRVLARIGDDLERRLGAPQDIEWALENDEIFVLQARPVTA